MKQKAKVKLPLQNNYETVEGEVKTISVEGEDIKVFVWEEKGYGYEVADFETGMTFAVYADSKSKALKAAKNQIKAFKKNENVSWKEHMKGYKTINHET